MIPDATIDEVRGRVDIVAVIGRHMELKRSGRTWKGCCVFHGERTPSFHVYPEDKHFKCYGCGEYGDVFKFLQKLQGKEFPEVVRALALEVGVEVPEREEDSAEQRQRRQERAEVLAACDAAARYFSARLQSPFAEPVRAYLSSRGFAEETVKLFRLGAASNVWDDLAGRLREKGVSQAALEKAGLVARKEAGGRYDRFRGRLIFPSRRSTASRSASAVASSPARPRSSPSTSTRPSRSCTRRARCSTGSTSPASTSAARGRRCWWRGTSTSSGCTRRA